MKRKLCLAIFEVVPLFASLFVVKAKPAPFIFESYIERYLVLILTFATWGFLREMVASGWAAQKADSMTRFVRIAICVLMFGVFALSLILLHERYEPPAFEMVLVAVGFGALFGRFLYQNRTVATAFTGLLYYAVITFLSFQVSVFSWQWEPFVFALGVGSLIVALRLSPGASRSNLALARTHTALLFLGPIFIGTLAVVRALPHQYFTIFVFIPIFSHFLSFDPNLKRSLPNDIFWRQSAWTFGFFGMLGALAFTL